VGSGVALAGGGGYLIFHSAAVENSAFGRQSVIDEAGRMKVIGIALTAVGSAAVLAGVVKFVLGHGSSENRTDTTATTPILSVGTHAVSLGLSGRF
jgi:hypothetical protein